MLHEFTLSEGKAMINFTLKYCDTKQKLLNSNGFRRVVKSFIELSLKKDEVVIYDYYVKHFGSESEMIDSLIESFKLLTVFDREDEVLSVDGKFSIIYENKDLFIELVDLLYRYWRKLERYSIVQNDRVGEGLQNVRFNDANDMFNSLVMATRRRIISTISGKKNRIFRQSVTGANAGLTLNEVKWNCPLEYNGLTTIPFISTVVFQPPFVAYTKKNTRDGIFQESNENPLEGIVLNEDDWFAFPAKVGDMLTFVYFHRDFMVHGITLGNLFELASEEEYIGKKPDLIYVFGYPDGYKEKRTFYYKDKKNDIVIGYANYCEEIDYFGYMKKMLLTLHNVKQIDNGCLPIHGAMVNIVLRNGKEANIIIMGDSGAGKSESLEALRTLNESYIRHMRTIFDDMGFLKMDADGKIKAYGTEIGAFVRVDDLDPAYAFEQLDRGIYTNMDQVNARVTIPITSHEIISKGYPIDYFLYANNYTDAPKKLGFFEDLKEAIAVFEDGARRAKGTTTEKGLVKSYFANPFGPVQQREATEKLVRSYFAGMQENGVKIGELYTNLAVEGKSKSGPKEAAEELFSLINQ